METRVLRHGSRLRVFARFIKQRIGLYDSLFLTLYLTPCSGAAARVRQLAVRTNLHLCPHHRGHRGAGGGGGGGGGGGDRQGSVLGQEGGAPRTFAVAGKGPHYFFIKAPNSAFTLEKDTIYAKRAIKHYK